MLLVIGGAVIFVGFILMMIGWIWLVVKGFQDSVLWGILNLIPLLALIFGFMHFSKCKVPVFLSLGGILAYVVGFVLTIMGAVALANDPAMQQMMKDALKNDPKALEQLNKGLKELEKDLKKKS